MTIPDSTQIIVVGPKRFLENRRAILQAFRGSGTSAKTPVDEEVGAVNATLAAQVPDGAFVDIVGAVCADGCPLFSETGDMLSYDGRHLTQAGAIALGQVLFAQPPLNAFR